MRLASKTISLLMLLFLVPAIPSTYSQITRQVPSPAIPNFSLQYSDTTTYIPPIITYSINPYNGNTTSTTIPERYIENKAVNITIENQPYPATVYGYLTNLYYNFRVKPHYSNFWMSESFTYFPMNDTSGIVGAGDFYLWVPSNSENTTIQYSVSTLQPGDVIDIQVEAILGYNYTTQRSNGNLVPPYNATLYKYQTSGWSSTQTITIPEAEPASTQQPTNEFLVIAIVLSAILVPAIVIIVRNKRRSKQ